jgi:cytochrome c biogenesis protein CcmG, thiol:disulfide interchange protein DsbE
VGLAGTCVTLGSVPRSALSRRRIAILAVAVLIVVAAVIGLVQTGGSANDPEAPSLAEARSALRDAPGPLRALYARGDGLVDVPADDFDAYLAKLRGYPTVINVWAEWCGPCREEFPLLRTAAARYGKQVAFLGVNVDAAADRGKAEAFLREQPTVYPSLTDPGEAIARRLEATGGRPQTVFLDPEGKIITVRQGSYANLEQVVRDLRLYAGLDGSSAPGAPGATTTEPGP